MAKLHFTEADWERVERDTMAWWNGELDRPLVYLTAADPVQERLTAIKPYSYQSNFPFNLPADRVVDCYQPFLESTRYYGDAFPWFWINFGPGIAAGFLGCDVNSVTDPSETVWFSPKMIQPIEEIQLKYDPYNIWLKRVKDITAAFVERFGSMLQVSHTDMGGNLDILASFRTTGDLLFDVTERPEEVERLVGDITKLWIQYYDELEGIIRPTCRGSSSWTPIWSSGRTYMLQCDFSYMISPKMFERYVVPDLTACCDHLDHGFYHLDGKGEVPHLPLLLEIERLRGIQWIPGDGQPSADQWLPLLKRIRDGGKLCQVFVSPQGARRIVQNLGGKGFLFVITDAGPEFKNPEVAEGFLKTLKEEDISQNG